MNTVTQTISVSTPPVYVDAIEFGKALSISPQAVRRLANQGVFPEPHKLGARRLWPWAVVLEAANKIASGELADVVVNARPTITQHASHQK
jgi:predicted DNA-binding transcriptional regulator AlpA